MFVEHVDLLIINSPLFREVNNLYDEDSLPPLGLGYIATSAKASGFKVKLIDAVTDRIPLIRLKKQINIENPSNIAINVFTTNLELVQEIVESASSDNTRIIIGGLSTRTIYKEIFNWNCKGEVDVVFGDGELIVPELLKGNRIVPELSKNNFRFFKIDKNSKYFCTDISSLLLDRDIFHNEPLQSVKGDIEAHIVASRGCIYNCAFCAAAKSQNRDLSIRERSIESLRSEVTSIKTKYPDVTSIRVLDDLFLKNNKSIDNAIAVFKDSGLAWRSMAHVMTFRNIKLDRLIELRNNGCKELFIGVESGSPSILKSIHKTYDIEKIKSNLFRVLQSGIALKCYFIFGFPGETAKDLDATYRLAEELNIFALKHKVGFRTSVFQFRPYHGTEIFHNLVNNGSSPSNLTKMEGDEKLSELVGRLQFNFHSGNYALASIDLIREYIHKTASLSTIDDWGL